MLSKDISDAHSENRIAVMAVSPREADHDALRNALIHTNWTLITAKTIAEALKLWRQHRVPVILCEPDLPDGTWKDLLNAGLEPSPSVVVTARSADDHLWAEVLNLGGYDVLSRPFELHEVVRVVSLAWHHGHKDASLPCAVG